MPFFLSHVLSSKTPSYGDRDSFKSKIKTSIKNGDTSNTSSITFTNNHLGTHIDAPLHFYSNGSKLTDFDASMWIFDKVKLIELNCHEAREMNLSDINEEIPLDTELILFKTGFEKYRNSECYWNNYPYFSVDFANYLKTTFKSLRCIGFDTISLTSPINKEAGKTCHKILLSESNEEKPILIVEDVSFKNVKSKIIDKVIISPLLYENCDGSPVTIIAFSKH